MRETLTVNTTCNFNAHFTAAKVPDSGKQNESSKNNRSHFQSLNGNQEVPPKRNKPISNIFILEKYSSGKSIYIEHIIC